MLNINVGFIIAIINNTNKIVLPKNLIKTLNKLCNCLLITTNPIETSKYIKDVLIHAIVTLDVVNNKGNNIKIDNSSYISGRLIDICFICLYPQYI